MSLQRSNYEHQLHLAQSKLDDKQMQLQRVEEQCEQFTQELQDSRRKLFET